MDYALEKSVKIQYHIELPINKDLSGYLIQNPENIHPDILNNKEVISVLAKNGVYMEINLVGTLILEMIISNKNINEINNKISFLFNEEKNIIKKDILLFLENLIKKGYLIKICLD